MVPALMIALSAVTACGGEGQDGPAGPAATVTATATITESITETVTETATPEPTPADDGSAALAFFAATELDCLAFSEAVGNSPVPHDYFADAQVVGDLGEDAWEVVDGAGNRLVVDLGARVVLSVDGPDAVLPYEYSFGCPSDLYLGSAAD